MSLTILVIQLPLTALWASTSLEDRTTGALQPQQPKRFIAVGSGDSNEKRHNLSGKTPLCRKEVGTTTTTSSMDSCDQKSPTKADYTLHELPATGTFRSIDVDIKMDERDMV